MSNIKRAIPLPQSQVDRALAKYLDEKNGGPDDPLGQPVGRVVAREQRAGSPSQARYAEDRDSYDSAMESYVRRGEAHMSEHERAVLSGGFDVETRVASQVYGSGPQGAYAVPESWQKPLEVGLKKFSGVLQGPVRRITTDHGNILRYPTIDDSGNAAAATDELGTINEVALTFDAVEVSAFKFTSLVRTSREFLADSSLDVPATLARLLGERIGRALAPQLVLGDGVAEPQGLLATPTLVTAAAAGAITRADVLNLIHAIDPAYRASPSFRLILNDSTLHDIKSLTIGTGDDRGLWQPAMALGEPSTIEGVPYIIDQALDDVGAGLRPMIAADLDQFLVRQAGAVRIHRLDELYAITDEIGWVVAARFDSRILDPGARAIAYLRNPGS
jgi:HK97 family phage major capsid protein